MSTIFKGQNDIQQIRDKIDLGSNAERKEAIRRVINLMRLGENVQVFFSSILQCVKTSDIELKKMIYLYLVHYSNHEPEQSIMAVNTFIQDSQDPNPLIRGLAVRNMCRIKVDSVAENMIIPLKKCIDDKDPYVRKSAILGIVKLYDVIPEAIENSQLFDDLLARLYDDNPLVVSNTTAAIFEINERRTTPIFEFRGKTIDPIINAISSSNEWCQTVLFDAISRYIPETSEEISGLIERITPFLNSSNPSVVIGAFKSIFLLTEKDKNESKEIFEKILPSILSLSSSAEYEIQYTVLRTISLFVKKYPKALSKEIRFFFCKYNDPSYIKLEKLDIILEIVTASTVQSVLDEFSEYINSVDVSFVRKTIQYIGKISSKINAAVRKCVDILFTCFDSKADYAIEEAIIVFCDILRKLPGEFESTLSTICSSFDKVHDTKAKASAIWILGEYAEIIENVDSLIDPFLDSFQDSDPLVQLQILTSIVKIYLIKPEETQDQLQYVLNEATKPTTVPDVKNRALLYWRLLSSDMNISKEIIKFKKQTKIISKPDFDDDTLNELLQNIGTISGVLHILPSEFVHRAKYIPDIDEEFQPEALRNWQQLSLSDESYISAFIDFDRNNMYFRVVNKSQTTLSNFAIAIDTNAIGLTIKDVPSFPQSLEFGDNFEVTIPISLNSSSTNLSQKDLHIAFRTNLGNIFAISRIPIEVTIFKSKTLSQEEYESYYNQFINCTTQSYDGFNLANNNELNQRNINIVNQNNNTLQFNFSILNNQLFIGEINQTDQKYNFVIKSNDSTYLPLIEQNIQFLFGKMQ